MDTLAPSVAKEMLLGATRPCARGPAPAVRRPPVRRAPARGELAGGGPPPPPPRVKDMRDEPAPDLGDRFAEGRRVGPEGGGAEPLPVEARSTLLALVGEAAPRDLAHAASGDDAAEEDDDEPKKLRGRGLAGLCSGGGRAEGPREARDEAPGRGDADRLNMLGDDPKRVCHDLTCW